MVSLVRILACCGALAAAVPAHASVDFSMLSVSVTGFGDGKYGFTQVGWSGGGMVTGTFTGFDIDNNGQLNSFLNEITNFSMTFSGSGMAPEFNLDITDLYQLAYTLDGGLLGDTVEENPEYFAESILASGAPGVYFVGPAVLSVCDGTLNCGIIHAIEGGFGPPLEPAAVPEPSSWSLLVAGFGLAGAALRRCSRYRAA